MITATSRYKTVTVETITDSAGRTHQSVGSRTPRSANINFTYYQIRQFDTLDTIAYGLLGDATLWWVIADANPEILDWTVLEVGRILRLPSVD